MFDDILTKKISDEDISEYDEYGYYKDNQQKNMTLNMHNESCDCDNCVTEAIKQVANKLSYDLTDDAIEKIKKEYFDKNTDPSMTNYTTKEGKLSICILRIFHKFGTDNCIRRFYK